MDFKPNVIGFLGLKSWDFASMLGLADMSGTGDLGPMWTDLELLVLSL